NHASGHIRAQSLECDGRAHTFVWVGCRTGFHGTAFVPATLDRKHDKGGRPLRSEALFKSSVEPLYELANEIQSAPTPDSLFGAPIVGYAAFDRGPRRPQLDPNFAFWTVERVPCGIGDQLVDDHAKTPALVRWQ